MISDFEISGFIDFFRFEAFDKSQNPKILYDF